MTVRSIATALSITVAATASAQTGDQLATIGQAYWDYANTIGRVPEVSLDKATRDAAFADSLLQLLHDIDPNTLSDYQWVTYKVIEWQLESAKQAPQLYWFAFPVTPYSSPLRNLPASLQSGTFNDKEDLDAYRGELRKVEQLARQIEHKFVAQWERGIRLPEPEFELAIPYIRGFVKPPETSPWNVPSEALASLEPADAARFLSDVREVIANSINPSLEHLAATLETEYGGHASGAVGLGQYPGGTDAYRLLVQLRTTLEITPEEIHRIGQEEMARLDAEMQVIRDSLGFVGTKAEFHEQIRNDRRFFVETPDEVGARLMAYDARIRPHVDRYFSRRPKADYGVRRLDPRAEGSMTYGFYMWPTEADPKGHYNYNGSDLDKRSLFNAGPITYHELVPGHHFHIALQFENDSIPTFRKRVTHTGFTEGWGEYASSVVARELGMYEDLYDRYARLVFDAFFANRLIIDTGMNLYGWSLDSARAFMLDHTLESDVQVATETLRYSVDIPAQALAYAMGRITMYNLREEARAALGDSFDIRRFHDTLLGYGSMPLVVLQEHVRRFIAREST